jgi:hypothetical protein
MYLETLRGIAGIGIFPALSLLLFVVIFAVVLYRVARMDRAQVLRYADLPFDGSGPLGSEERGNAHER